MTDEPEDLQIGKRGRDFLKRWQFGAIERRRIGTIAGGHGGGEEVGWIVAAEGIGG